MTPSSQRRKTADSKKSRRSKSARPSAAAKKPAKPAVYSDDQFRLMVEAVMDYAIYLLDPDGKIVSWNPGAKRMKGYLASEVLGKNFSMFFTDSDVRDDRPKKEL